MNIRLVSDVDLDNFETLFPDIKLFDSEDKEPIDLLVFPGGEDVSLEYYLEPDEIERYKNICHTNKQRDEYERNILFSALSGQLDVNKILGVCRGTQFINVMFGGILYPDLRKSGIFHAAFHELRHIKKSPLSFMTAVNSLHHQGIMHCGEYIKELDKKTYPIVIATDAGLKVREIVSWCDDKVLGIQYHPEYYDDTFSDKIKFREVILSWISGETIIGDRRLY